MKKLVAVILWFIISSFATVEARIYEAQTPDELFNTLKAQIIDQSTLVVFDIDDTLIMHENPLFRASNLDALLDNIERKLNCSTEQAINLVQYFLIQKEQHLGKGNIVSNKIYDILDFITHKNANIIALTKVNPGPIKIVLTSFNVTKTMPITYEDQRFNDLKNASISFQNVLHNEYDGYLELIPLIDKDLNKSNSYKFPVFKNGILLTGSLSKGEALAAFLKQLSWKPTKVIFVDDKSYHISSVQEHMKKLGLKYIGINFTYVDNIDAISSKEIEKFSQTILDSLRNNISN